MSSDTMSESTDQFPVHYCDRLSFLVLEVVRRLQQQPIFETGVQKLHIVNYLKHQPFADGDICSQVSTALRELENSGLVMYMKGGYKTLGPFAKICCAKTPKQRRLAWRKLELKLGINSVDPEYSNLCPEVNCPNTNDGCPCQKPEAGDGEEMEEC